MKYELFLNETYLQYGIEKYIIWDTDVAPHGAIFGTTGSGKTYAEKILLARISLKCPSSQFFICDFKGDSDFSFLAGAERFYRYAECKKGLDNLDKKVAEEEKKKLAILLMLGRSFNVHVLLCMQRLDVAYIQSRDCINLD